MKGYVTNVGYMGYVDGEYMLFATEEDYRDFVLENDDPVVNEADVEATAI